jgi:hypothetical protein
MRALRARALTETLVCPTLTPPFCCETEQHNLPVCLWNRIAGEARCDGTTNASERADAATEATLLLLPLQMLVVALVVLLLMLLFLLLLLSLVVLGRYCAANAPMLLCDQRSYRASSQNLRRHDLSLHAAVGSQTSLGWLSVTMFLLLVTAVEKQKPPASVLALHHCIYFCLSLW